MLLLLLNVPLLDLARQCIKWRSAGRFRLRRGRAHRPCIDASHHADVSALLDAQSFFEVMLHR